jgi:hypothetical protein
MDDFTKCGHIFFIGQNNHLIQEDDDDGKGGKMTIHELVEKLKSYPGEMDVCIWDTKKGRFTQQFEIASFELSEELYITPFSETCCRTQKR